MLSFFVGRYIPGSPRVVVTNETDRQVEYLFAAVEAPKDGTYISFNSALQIAFGFDDATRNIKRSTFQAIGSLSTPPEATLWLPPGTPDHIATVLADAFEQALTTNQELTRLITSVTGDPVDWFDRDALQAETLRRERQFQE